MATDTDFKVKHGLVVTEDIELGHATDTTLSRSSGGVLAVEGVVVPTISSTNTLTNKTLTSPVLTGLIDTTLTSGSEQVLISDTSDTALVKIVQLGTGNAFEVHDQASDSTIFSINHQGYTSIGVSGSVGNQLHVAGDIGFADSTIFASGSSGKFRALDGTAAAPYYTFSNDVDMGMYRGGTDILGFSTAGTERMTISASGVVNIAGSLTVAGSAVGGASVISGLTDVTMDATNFVDSFLLQTNSDGSAPSTGTLSSATGNTGIGKGVFSSLTSGTYNDVIGYEAGDALTEGGLNVLIGQRAGGALTTGDYNVFIGATAGDKIVDTNHNVGIGYESFGGSNTGNAQKNVGVGSFTLSSISSGDNNVVAGYYAGFAVDSGSDNILLGFDAGKTITTGDKNICIGHGAGDGFNTESGMIAIGEDAMGGTNEGGAYNIAIGNNAMLTSTSATYTIAIGQGAGQNTSTGGNNVFVGANAAYANTTGTRNIAIGRNAYDASDTENDNIAIGYDAMTTNTAGGEKNIAIGNYALDATTSGDKNVAIGHEASSANAAGEMNTAIGYNAHLYITGTSSNTLIGANAGRGQSGEAGGHDNVVVGKGAFYNWTTGGQNLLLGKDAGYKIRSGTGNVVLGHQGHSQNWADGNYNTAVGYQAQSHMNGGANNISIGYQAGNNITDGDNNVVIGAADVTAGEDDQLSISSGDGGVWWITGDSNGGIASRAQVVAVTGTTQLTAAQSGSYVYVTGSGAVELPDDATIGLQYTIFNNKGSDLTLTGLGDNNSMASSWAGVAAVADNDATSFVCVSAGNWVQVGA